MKTPITVQARHSHKSTEHHRTKGGVGTLLEVVSTMSATRSESSAQSLASTWKRRIRIKLSCVSACDSWAETDQWSAVNNMFAFQVCDSLAAWKWLLLFSSPLYLFLPASLALTNKKLRSVFQLHWYVSVAALSLFVCGAEGAGPLRNLRLWSAGTWRFSYLWYIRCTPDIPISFHADPCCLSLLPSCKQRASIEPTTVPIAALVTTCSSGLHVIFCFCDACNWCGTRNIVWVWMYLDCICAYFDQQWCLEFRRQSGGDLQSCMELKGFKNICFI